MEQKKGGDGVVVLIDFDANTDQWLAVCGDPGCPNTGEFARSDGGSPIEHDQIWITGARHEEFFHDGDGQIWYDALLTVRPHPVPHPSWKGKKP